jgi:hypothetical protein
MRFFCISRNVLFDFENGSIVPQIVYSNVGETISAREDEPEQAEGDGQ